MWVKVQNNSRARPIFISVLLICVSVGGFLGRYIWYWEHLPHVLDVRCFSVEGNVVVFIRTPNGHTILIDGGKSDAILRTLTSLLPFYRRSIDTVILTEPDDSHATGLVSVVSRYYVGRVFEPDFTISTTSSYIAFEKSVAARDVPEQKLRVSQMSLSVLNVGVDDATSTGLTPNTQELDQGVAMDVLFPSASFSFSKSNPPLLEVRISYGNTEFVIGNISKSEQKFVISSSSLVLPTSTSTKKIAVIIMPHGGSKGTVDRDFFTDISPQYVVISKKPLAEVAGLASKNKLSQKSPSKSTPKPPFDILNIPAGMALTHFDIDNLALEENAEFISDGIKISH